MSRSYWEQVTDSGFAVPSDRALDELAAELTTMLGSTDPAIRDSLAYSALATWIGRGVYDDLLPGLGDGMSDGLLVGLGEHDTDSVFRRSFSVLVLATCIERDNEQHLLPPATIATWGDRIATWYVRERDLRGYVPAKGWAHTVAHGADAIGELAASRHLGLPELVVLLDVLADRLLTCTDAVLTCGEPDRLALATRTVLRRGLVPPKVVEPWLRRIASATVVPPAEDRDPFLTTANPEAFLRALHLQLELSPDPPPSRSDLLLVLTGILRDTNASYLRARPG
jgi:hypothetical protein